MKYLIRFALAAIAVFVLLSIPLPERRIPDGGSVLPFAWNQDAAWTSLETRFLATSDAGCSVSGASITIDLARLDDLVDALQTSSVSPLDAQWDLAEEILFKSGAAVAACPEFASSFVESASSLRQVAKSQSVNWDVTTVDARRRLYRVLYGARAAIEEVLSQSADTTLALVLGLDEPSVVPSAVVQGVRIHSGDLLVSRGGFPTSALISRGSDYPGNFSHVALAHVDANGVVSVVEAHIEVGMAVASVDKYLSDKKLRLMVLRLRSSHPALLSDPMLPHRAAEYALGRATAGHVPYDFAMDYQDPEKLFCSEVASNAYSQFGVTLWTGISTISTPGLRSWLGAFGVQHFETQEPSDLEYDPQLVVVAEWRDPAALRMDRIDNAVVDAMLETAEKGKKLGYNRFALAPGRLAKGYSLLRNTFGSPGPVPEGMSAVSALRNRSYTASHDAYAQQVDELAASFARENGYEPPYWRLVEMARSVVSEE